MKPYAIEEDLKRLLLECKADRRAFVASRAFGLLLIVGIAPFIAVLVAEFSPGGEGDLIARYLFAHPNTHRLAQLSATLLVVSGIAFKLLQGRPKLRLIAAVVSTASAAACAFVGWLVLLCSR